MQNTTIRPQLRMFDLTVIVVGLVIGMGIFGTPPEVAQKAQLPTIFFLAWGVGTFISFIGALTFAEIGSRLPAAGGYYKIFSHCYHPAFAFMINWVTLISNAGATAAAAMMGAAYIAPLLFPTWEPALAVQVITISAVLFLYVINLIGLRTSARVLNLLMFIKVGMLLLIIASIFALPASTSPAPAPTADFSVPSAFALCFIPVFFTCGGYQQTINFGTDIANPKRNLPRSIFMGMAIVTALYFLVNYAYVHALGFGGLQQTKTLAADIAGLMLGDIAARLVAVVMFCSVMAYVNVSIMTNPRVYFAMAEDGVLPEIFKRVHPRTQVQGFAVTVFCGFTIATLFFMSSFQKALDYVMFMDSISLITAASTIFVLRQRAKKLGEPEGIYKLWGYPFLPALFVLVYVIVNVSVFRSNPETSLWGVLLFATGWPLYYLMRRWIGKAE